MPFALTGISTSVNVRCDHFYLTHPDIHPYWERYRGGMVMAYLCSLSASRRRSVGEAKAHEQAKNDTTDAMMFLYEWQVFVNDYLASRGVPLFQRELMMPGVLSALGLSAGADKFVHTRAAMMFFEIAFGRLMLDYENVRERSEKSAFVDEKVRERLEKSTFIEEKVDDRDEKSAFIDEAVRLIGRCLTSFMYSMYVGKPEDDVRRDSVKIIDDLILRDREYRMFTRGELPV